MYGISVGNCNYSVKPCVWDQSQCVYGISVGMHVQWMENVRVAMDTCSEWVTVTSCSVSFALQLIIVPFGRCFVFKICELNIKT